MALLDRGDVENVLIFRALQVGDMLCAVPALRALRARLPRAHLALVGLPWASWFAARFDAYLDEFIVFPGHPELPERAVAPQALPAFEAALSSRRWDLAIQLHGSGVLSNAIVQVWGARRTAGHVPPQEQNQEQEREDDAHVPWPQQGSEADRLLGLMHRLGAPSCGSELEFPLRPEDEAEMHALNLHHALAPASFVCLHPGARQRSRCWPSDAFAALAARIVEGLDLDVVLTGGPGESELTQAVIACVPSSLRTRVHDSAGPSSLGAMAAVMQRSRLLVCNDTGASHLAAGLGLRSVVIFHHDHLERWAPQDRQRHVCLLDPQGSRLEDVWRAVTAQLSMDLPREVSPA